MEDKYGQILEHWNSYRETGSGWQGHRKLTYDIRLLIKKELVKGWTVQDIVDAISVFAMVFFEKRYKWSYLGWNLKLWLSRNDKDDADLKQWYRWLPNNFVEDTWLSDQFRDSQTTQITKEQVEERQREHYRTEYGGWIEENDLDTIKKSIMWNFPIFQELVKEIKA